MRILLRRISWEGISMLRKLAMMINIRQCGGWWYNRWRLMSYMGSISVRRALNCDDTHCDSLVRLSLIQVATKDSLDCAGYKLPSRIHRICMWRVSNRICAIVNMRLDAVLSVCRFSGSRLVPGQFGYTRHVSHEPRRKTLRMVPTYEL